MTFIQMSKKCYKWNAGGKEVLLGNYPKIMGILNVTPDSFSDGGLYNSDKKAVDKALQMIDEGADIIDIGGESTRPGSEKVSLNDEISRTINIIKLLRKINPEILISIDTSKSIVAKLAMEEGANIINDVSSYNNDKKMMEVVKNYNAGIILMHMQGTPKNMQKNPFYKNVVEEVLEFIDKKISLSLDYGIKNESIVIDPGIGFGKNLKQNLTLLRSLDRFIKSNPTLVGLSRKSFIGEILKEDNPKKRLAGSLGASAFAIMKGAHIVRVHDVKETSDICKILTNLF
mgnify:CR=1 FL=1